MKWGRMSRAAQIELVRNGVSMIGMDSSMRKGRNAKRIAQFGVRTEELWPISQLRQSDVPSWHMCNVPYCSLRGDMVLSCHHPLHTPC